MKASDFERELEAEGILPKSACTIVRKLRDFINGAVPAPTGLRGRIMKAIAPGTVRGIREVVAFLDEFLKRNCDSARSR